MQRSIIEILILFTALCCAVLMLKKLPQQNSSPLSFRCKLKLAVSGVFAFFMDTIGVGSFACNIAFAKNFKTFKDNELPGMVNGAQVIPGAFEALFFLGLVSVDDFTLLVMVVATCLGGIVGASFISKLNTQAIRFIMMLVFPIVALLILSNEFHWLPVGGDKTALHGYELLLAFVGLFFAGALTSVGVGLFALVQAILFCLGMSPLVAFPIMNAAGALQQPLTTSIFVMKNKVPLKKSLIISGFGVLGVLLAIPIITHLDTTVLHALLVVVLIYNTAMMGLSYLKHRKPSLQNTLEPQFDQRTRAADSQ